MSYRRGCHLALLIVLVTSGCGDQPAPTNAPVDTSSFTDSLGDTAAFADTTTNDSAVSDSTAIGAKSDTEDISQLIDAVAHRNDGLHGDTDAASSAPDGHVADTVDEDSGVETDDTITAADIAPGDVLELPSCTQHSDCPSSPNPCADILCGPSGSCEWVYLPAKTTCDDADPCTVGETCDSAHQCSGGGEGCGCSSNADCAKLNDDNDCNGTMYCDTSGPKSLCKVNPATVVLCPKIDKLCHANNCLPKNGKCYLQPVADNTPCEDGVLCTKGEACYGGQCLGGKSVCQCQSSADCAVKEDDNLCNGTLYCDNTAFPHTCKVNPKTVVVCPNSEDSDCIKNTCDKATAKCAMAPAPEKQPCEDGNKCTKGDFCTSGSCEAGTDICPCKKQSDCANFEDGDPCNGTLYCNFALKVPACSLNPATVINCPTAADTVCRHSKCQKQTGACKVVPRNELDSCEDGNPCTSDDRCTGGKCVATVNTCQCKLDADCAKHEDGDLCNGTLYCDKSKAPFRCLVKPISVVRCNRSDDTACLANTCQKKTGACLMTAIREQLPCDADANPCTKSDVCEKGACVAGTNICKCESNADCGPHEDANICNGTLYCDKLASPPRCKVNPATVIQCPDGKNTQCLQRLCQPETGKCVMGPVNQGQPCNADDNACTPDDTCNAGKCNVGTNVCACTSDKDCAGNNDGNLCNGGLYCDKTTLPFRCKVDPTTVVQCPADKTPNDCLKPTCAPLSGACTTVHREDNAACSDDNPCTFGDRCAAGTCASGKNLCTCDKDAECAVYDDANACNGVFWCDKTSAPWSCRPKPSSAVTCPEPKTPCAQIACRPKDGLCLVTPNKLTQGKSCDDGDACTTQTTCAGLGCSAGKAVNCDDGNACTHDACQPLLATGCVHLAVKVTCDDGDPCTENDGCAAAKCQSGGPVNCDDANTCTHDSCKSAGDGAGCNHALNKAPCDDGNKCTTEDACKQGACVAGPKRECDDGNICTNDSCKPGESAAAGCQFVANAAQCDDKNPCTGKDRCDGKLCVAGDKLSCDDTNPCTNDSCDPTSPAGKACKHVPNTAPCEDGKVCSAGGLCANGSCVSFKKDRLFNKLHGSTGNDEWRSVATANDLGAWLVGQTAAGAKGSTDGWLMRVNRAGATTWQRKTGDPNEDVLTGVSPVADGAVAVGWVKRPTGLDMLALGVDNKGKISWSTSAGLAEDDQAEAVTRSQASTLFAVGVAGGKPLVVGLSTQGKLGFKKKVAAQNGHLYGARSGADGSLIAAGTYHVSGKQTDCALVLVKADGTVSLTRTFGGLGAEHCADVTPHHSGYALIGREPFGVDKTRMVLWRVDSGGGLVFKRAWSEFPSSAGLAIASTIGGGLRIGGRAYLNVDDVRLLQVNEHGQVDWAYNYGLGGLQQANGLSMLPDGGMWVVGVDDYSGSGGRDGFLRRLDAWGHDNCYEAGGCADTTLAACVDANPCTRDVCTHKKGCHHPIHPNYTPCGDKKICGVGECK